MMDVVSERGQNVTPLDLWPCPIGLFNAGEGVRELNKLLVKDAFEEKTKERNRPSRTGVDVWQSSNTLQDKYESFQQLQQILGGAVFAMMARCGYKEESQNLIMVFINPTYMVMVSACGQVFTTLQI